MKKFNKKGGFTLIEILVVIGIIAILAAIVIIAINPKKHFDDATAAQRDANVNAILNAIGQYVVDNKGTLPSDVDSGAEEISTALCNDLVTEYIGAIPSDPKSFFAGAGVTNCSDIDVGGGEEIDYTVEGLADGHVRVCTTLAPAPQLCLTR
jgi:prepilin-type N-terminal cleavage/methylation domain-containing protein